MLATDTACQFPQLDARQTPAENEKVLRETQTLRAGCSKAEPKIFAPSQTPTRGRGTAKI